MVQSPAARTSRHPKPVDVTVSPNLLIAVLCLLVAVGYLVWRLQFALHSNSATGEASPSSSSNLKPEEKALLRLIRSVPKGKVTTFAILAHGLEGNINPAQVSRMVHQLASQKHLPWWRVVRKEGRRGLLPISDQAARQRKKLIADGVEFEEDTIPLRNHIWEP